MTYLFNANTNANVVQSVKLTANVQNNNAVVSSSNPLPVTLGSENITITGNVNFVDTVNVASSPENPVHVHLTEVGTSGNLTTSYLPIGGNVNVGNWQAYTNANITSSITLATNVQNNGATVTISNPFPVTGNVNVSNWQAYSNVNVTNSITLTTNIQNNNSVVSSANPLPVTAQITGTVTSTVIDGAADAFGRLRISDAFTLGDYKHLYGLDPNFRDTVTPGGTVTFQTNQACARLATNNSPTASVIHQTKMYHQYQPGKSQLIKSTFNFYANVPNVIKRTGYFDANNGIYLEQSANGALSFTIRSDVSGTPSDTRRVYQSEWNHDTCNTTIAGTTAGATNFGQTGSFNLDITKTQIFFTDFQWLGVGRVRCGFVHNGNYIIAHEFYNSNMLPTVYMSNPNLPVRCEIINTGATTGGYFDQICSTVISEGGYVEAGQDWHVSTGNTKITVTGAGNTVPIMAIRLKNSFRGYQNRAIARMGDINLYAEQNPGIWELKKLDSVAALTLANSTWVSAHANSAVEYNITGTAVSGGEPVSGGFVGTSSPGGSAKGFGLSSVTQPTAAKKNYIAQNYDSSNSEIFVVTVSAITSPVDVWCTVSWREIY